jgi:hypothetical protein
LDHFFGWHSPALHFLAVSQQKEGRFAVRQGWVCFSILKKTIWLDG